MLLRRNSFNMSRVGKVVGFLNPSILRRPLSITTENCKLAGEKNVFYSDGGNFVGTWAQCKRNGYGFLFTHNGNSFEGNWKDDRPVEWVSHGNREGSYFGKWANGQRNGLGYFTSSDFIYVGIWKDDWRVGPGFFRIGGEIVSAECIASNFGMPCKDDIAFRMIQSHGVSDLILYQNMLAEVEQQMGLQKRQREDLFPHVRTLPVTVVDAGSNPPYSADDLISP